MTFDWTIDWIPTGPARLAAGTTFLTGLYSPDFSSPHNMTAFDAAEGQDFFEAFSKCPVVACSLLIGFAKLIQERV